MKTRIAAALAALMIGATATAPALAFTAFDRGGLGVHDHPRYERCVASSASEGNANQQTRPVKQYGQTSGGYRC